MAKRLPPLPSLLPKIAIKPPTVDFVSGGEGAGVSFSATGFKALEEYLLEAPKYIRDAAGFEMASIAADVITDAKTNYVPYKNGHLQESGDSDEYQPGSMMAGGISQIKMWFGAPLSGGQSAQALVIEIHEGVSTPDPSRYAWIQHEINFEHPIVGPVTNPQMKYLERPFIAAEPTILARIAAAIEAATGGALAASSLTQNVNTSQSFMDISMRISESPLYPAYGAGKGK